MQFYDVINKRTSIKKFKDTNVSKDKISRMITAAMMSPSWKNKSSYKFVLVNNEDEKNKLADTIQNKTSEAAESIKDAPMVAIIVANPQESGIMNDKEYYLVDSAIAMEHFVLAATEEGYGTCWIAAFDEKKVKNIFNIPNEYKIVAMTPIGEPAEEKPHYDKKDVRDYVFVNSWNKSYTENCNCNCNCDCDSDYKN